MFLDKFSETTEIDNKELTNNNYIEKICIEKFEFLMGDNELEDTIDDNISDTEKNDYINKFEDMFFEDIEFENDKYEIDENGSIYKTNDDFLPNIEYVENGNTYKTDDLGRIVHCKGIPQYTEYGNRNIKEQLEAGGNERQELDDGGHIIAKVLGGSEGSGNLVPMRRTINRGDYKKMENEISRALQLGKDVSMEINIDYIDNSKRPSKLQSTYFIDGIKTTIQFENEECSTELMSSLPDLISDYNYNSLEEEINEMAKDGIDTSITSVKVEYNEENMPLKITVGILDESTGEKSYKVYEAKKGEHNENGDFNI